MPDNRVQPTVLFLDRPFMAESRMTLVTDLSLPLQSIEEGATSRDAKVNWLTLSLLGVLLVAGPSRGQAVEAVFQADVYDVLYRAHVQCDGDMDQSRSEFITDMFDRHRGNRVSIDLLKKLLAHRINVATQSMAEKERERELYVAEVLQTPASDKAAETPEASKQHHQDIEQIDGLLKRERQYLEANECVLAVLQSVPAG